MQKITDIYLRNLKPAETTQKIVNQRGAFPLGNAQGEKDVVFEVLHRRQTPDRHHRGISGPFFERGSTQS